MSPSSSAKRLTMTGLAVGIVLAAACAAWPEARAIGLVAGVAIAFLGFALGQGLQLILSQLSVKPEKDASLEGALVALRDGLQALPGQMEAPLRQGQKELNTHLSQEMAGLSSKLQSGLTEGLREQGHQLGQSIATEQKQTAQQIEASLQKVSAFLEAQAAKWRDLVQADQQRLEAQFDVLKQAHAQNLSELSQGWQKASAEALAAWKADFKAQALEAMNASAQQSQQLATRLHETAQASQQNLVQVLAEVGEANGRMIQSQLESAISRLTDNQTLTLKDASEQIQSVLSVQTESAMAQAKAIEDLANSAGAALQATAKEWTSLQAETSRQFQEQSSQLATHLEQANAKIATLVQSATAALSSQADSSKAAADAAASVAVETGKAQQALGQFETAAQLNQLELQNGIAMLNSALGNLLDRLEGQAQAGESQAAFLGKLEAALAAYQERSGEILTENALKTQEILMEALQALDGRSQTNMLSDEPQLG